MIYNEGAYLTFKTAIRPSIYFCSIVKSRPNQPVLSNKGKVSCSRKQQGPLVGLEPTTSTLRVRRATLFSDSTKISSISVVLCISNIVLLKLRIVNRTLLVICRSFELHENSEKRKQTNYLPFHPFYNTL